MGGKQSIPQGPIEKLTSIKDIDKLKIFGCVFGAFVGDAAGGVLEFKKSISQEDVNNALTFPGGGAMQLGKGQITDDSEMALCIIHGILELNRKGLNKEIVLDLDNITKYFGKWYKCAFGNTTQKALRVIDINQPRAYKSYRNTLATTYSSVSNGCLMRITPLAIFGHKLSDKELFEAVQLQTNLTHPHAVANQACYLYCLAIKFLINNPDDAIGAYNQANQQSGILVDWFVDLENNKLPVVSKGTIGNLKISFMYSFYFLRKCHEDETYSYSRCIDEMLLLGGDTDTNAAIVGGLIGAYKGLNDIPEAWIEAVLSFKVETKEDSKAFGGGIPRPKFLIPQYTLVDDLMTLSQNAPTKLKVRYDNELIDDFEQIQQILPEAHRPIVGNLINF